MRSTLKMLNSTTALHKARTIQSRTAGWPKYARKKSLRDISSSLEPPFGVSITIPSRCYGARKACIFAHKIVKFKQLKNWLSRSRLKPADISMQPMSFVTGASGFVGSRLVGELLDRGHSVTAMVRAGASVSALRAAARGREVTLVGGDLRRFDKYADTWARIMSSISGLR